MRAYSSAHPLPFIALGLSALAASAGSCANGTVYFVGQSGGSFTADAGGDAGTGAGQTGGGQTGGSGAGGSDAGSDAPIACLHQTDCLPVADACNSGSCLNNVCVKTPANEGGTCNDGLYCTDNDTCTMGVCAGTPKVCPGTDNCHVGMCDEASQTCGVAPGNDGSPCSPTSICFLTGFCSGGTCVGETPQDCSFLDDQCDTGTCDPVMGCVKTPNNGFPCFDGSICTMNKICQNGVCAGGTPVVCPPAPDPCQTNTCVEGVHSCEVQTATNGTPCSTGNPCKTAETCTTGTCGGGTPTNQGMSCTSPSACQTNAVCTQGACAGTPITACINNDGCCPTNCTPANDDDCNCAMNLALTAVGSASSGGSPPCCGPSRMNDGIGSSDCNDFSWISNGPPPSTAYWELDWPAAVTIGSFYVEAEASDGSSPCSEPAGRNIASADVQTWNGSAWVTSTSFSGMSGPVQINLPTAVTTTKLRLANVTSSPGNGNSIMFEWHVYSGVGCIPPAD